MATRSSILAWEIPRTEEPDWLESMEVTRESGYDSVTKQQVVKETEMEIEIARTV